MESNWKWAFTDLWRRRYMTAESKAWDYGMGKQML